MTIEQTREKIVGSIWQAIAQSGVDLSTVPHDQQEKLVESIANSALMSLNSILEEVPKPPTITDEPIDTREEKLWEGRPFLSLVETYLLTSERIKITKGFLGRDVENFELIRVQDIDLSQGLSERILNIGDISIKGHDTSHPEVILRNISKPDEVYEILRQAWLTARKRHGLQFREYM